MTFFDTDIFAAGDPHVHFMECLQGSVRELSALLNGRRRLGSNELEPFWHFVETMSLARLYGVDKAYFNAVDRQLEKMNRARVIDLALTGFLTPALNHYFVALEQGDVTATDAVMFYLRMRTALDLIEDNVLRVDADAALEGKVTLLRDVVRKNCELLQSRAVVDPAIPETWRIVLKRAEQDRLPADFAELLV